MKVLIVSKDGGGGEVAAPLAKIALESGDEAVVITEGLAAGCFVERKVPIYFQGTQNFHEEPFTLDAYSVLKKVRPDVVVTTEGSPIYLEERFGDFANHTGIPLVFLEDCTGGFVRSRACPNLVLTLDEYAGGLVKGTYPKVQVEVVGNPGVPSAEEVTALRDKYLADFREEGPVFVYVGGEPDTTGEQLALLLKCLELTKGEWRLIPRFHPKWTGVVGDLRTGRTYGELWMRMLEPIKSRLVSADVAAKTAHAVSSAAVTIGDFSTLLTTATCCGKTAVLLETPAVLEHMENTTGLRVMPLVEQGFAHAVREPQDLSVLHPPAPDKLATLKPYDAAKAYECLKKFVGK